MGTSSIISSSKLKKTRTNNPALSLGLALPFNPCMQDETTIQNLLRYSETSIQTMLEGCTDTPYREDIFRRLKKIFGELNYHSHCKGIAVLLTPGEERVTYLNFPVKPVTYLNKYVSLLELTANADRQPGFYFLVLRQSRAKLYEYHHNQPQQVYATKQEPRLNEKNNSEILFIHVLQTIERINRNNEKPVFVSGSPNLVELFCNSSCYSGVFFRLLENVAPFDEAIIKRCVKDIISNWIYWQSKFVIDRIMITKKATVLIAGIEAVLPALRNSIDGLLLVDKRLRQRLYKSRRANALFNTGDELMNHVERFLIRGNCIEITETGLLKEVGGIVLLPYKPAHFFTISPVTSIGKCKRPDTF